MGVSTDDEDLLQDVYARIAAESGKAENGSGDPGIHVLQEISSYRADTHTVRSCACGE